MGADIAAGRSQLVSEKADGASSGVSVLPRQVSNIHAKMHSLAVAVIASPNSHRVLHVATA
jgi:hypothetical protein